MKINNSSAPKHGFGSIFSYYYKVCSSKLRNGDAPAVPAEFILPAVALQWFLPRNGSSCKFWSWMVKQN